MKLKSVFAALLCILLAASPAGSGSMLLTGVGPPPVAAGGATTTFDPSDLGTAITLSLGNLKATNPSGGNAFAHSVAAHSTGKFYYEATNGQATNAGIGVLLSGTSVNTFMGDANNSVGCAFGFTTYSGGSVACPPYGTASNGHVFGVAVDLTARNMWIKDLTAASNWNANGTADPATGVGGQTLAGNMATGNITALFNGGTAGDNATANFGGSAYVGTPPAGFGNW